MSGSLGRADPIYKRIIVSVIENIGLILGICGKNRLSRAFLNKKVIRQLYIFCGISRDLNIEDVSDRRCY